MSELDLLNLIKQTVKDNSLTAYEIGKNTQISTFAIQKILDGTTKKPNRKTLMDIFNYLHKNLPGTNLPMVSEPAPQYSTLKITTDKVVPYYNIEISGSYIRSFDDAKEHIKFYVDYPPLNDCTAFMPYAGDSMLPRYKSGDTLGVKQIRNFDVILWGEAHLVITNDDANNLKTVKNIYPHHDPAKIILRAINPDYLGDTVVNKADVLSLFIVKGKVELNQI